MGGHATIEIEEVSKTFPTAHGEPVEALKNITLEISDEICILLGPSCCGRLPG